jgi:tryptophan 2,3-dioxygenase
MMQIDYSTHLKLPQLLNLQERLSRNNKNDELPFIIIHQVNELLFKMLLNEIDHIKDGFCDNNVDLAIEKWKRCKLILNTSISQFDTIETILPPAFNQFREFLGNASGLQSYQFREIEFILGYKRSKLIEIYAPNSIGYTALYARLTAASLIDCLYIFLKKNGANLPNELFEREVTLGNLPDENVQKYILSFYTAHSNFRILFESMLDFDASFAEWRFRHWNTVKRVIGDKRGTGGTTQQHHQTYYEMSQQMFFPDLWSVRNKL